jgi:hypothetical protein
VHLYSLSRPTCPCIISLFSPYIRLCCIDSGYREVSGLVEDSIQEMLEDLLQA